MGACRTVDPAGHARPQQANVDVREVDEPVYKCLEHGIPVAGDPERTAAALNAYRFLDL